LSVLFGLVIFIGVWIEFFVGFWVLLVFGEDFVSVEELFLG
jgi:hypothetical protein